MAVNAGDTSNRNTLLEQDKRQAIFDKFIKDKGIKQEQLSSNDSNINRSEVRRVDGSVISDHKSLYSSASKLSVNPMDLIS